MPCSDYPDGSVAERYVAGTLSEPEQAAFEMHFFACETCLAVVRDLQSLRETLAPAPVPRRFGRPWMVGLAVAASLVAAVAAWRWTHPTVSAPAAAVTARDEPRAASTRRAALVALAAVTPPPYEALATRGPRAGTASRVAEAMASYAAGRFAEAADRLAIVNHDTPDLPESQFYEGVSALLAGRPAAARAALEQAAGSGVAPWSDEAHFYLAKAWLAEADSRSARTELAKAVAASAGPDGEARRLLQRLDALGY